jgi:predicted nucleotidyltransferase
VIEEIRVVGSLGILALNLPWQRQTSAAEWLHDRVAISMIEQRLSAMAAVIHQVIPGSEVRLFGSRARGQAGPDSDIDLLITAPDSWLEHHHRFAVLNDLWDQLAQADVSLDLLLYSQSECEARRHWRSHVIGRAYREGKLLNGPI